MLLNQGRRALEATLTRVADSRDRAVLSALIARGDKLDAPRPTRFIFSRYNSDMRGSREALDPLAEAATKAGYAIQERREAGLTLEIAQTPAPEIVNSARSLMEDWARRFRLEFRGWQCTLVSKQRSAPKRGPVPVKYPHGA